MVQNTSTGRVTAAAAVTCSSSFVGGRTLESDDRSALQCAQSKYPI